jgi:hypothetical protein
MKRTLVRGSLFLAAAALATSGLVSAPAGAAAPPQQKCTGLKGTVTIKPGINNTPRPQTATAKANATGCTPKTKTGGSGVMTATLKLPSNSSCAGLATGNSSLKMTAKIVWKNKKTSALALTAKTGTGANVLTANITGKVTSGLFKGRPVTSQIKVKPAAGQNCTTVPVTKMTFTNSKPFLIK